MSGSGVRPGGGYTGRNRVNESAHLKQKKRCFSSNCLEGNLHPREWWRKLDCRLNTAGLFCLVDWFGE